MNPALGEFAFHQPRDHRGARCDSEFREDAAEMRADRPCADLENSGDGFVRIALGDHARDFELARAEGNSAIVCDFRAHDDEAEAIGGRSHALRRIAIAAARQAMRGAPRRDPAIEGESEFEMEGEQELELEASAAELAQIEGIMEHAGHAAAEAANEQEAAEHFLPLIPLAAKFAASKLLPLAAKAGAKFLAKSAPKLIGKFAPRLIKKFGPRLLGRVAKPLTRSLANVTRTLYRNPATRPLMNVMPTVARRTMLNLVGQIGKGKRITPQTAVRTLARQTYRTLRNPKLLSKTYRRSLALDKRYHRQTRRVLGQPPVRRAGYPGAVGPAGGGRFIPGASYSPDAAPGWPAAVGGYPGGAPSPGFPAAMTGGCNCRCQCPAGAGAYGAASAPLSMPIPAAPPTCPTCGR